MKIRKIFDKNNEIRKRSGLAGRVLKVNAAVITVMSLTACSFLNSVGSSPSMQTNAGAASTVRVDTGFVLTGPESFDSADTPVLVGKNAEEGTVTFLNLDLGRRYTLSVDGTTRFYDRYGESISLDQLKDGDIVDITFLKSEKHLTSMQLSEQAWSRENVDQYEINVARSEVTIGRDVYSITSNTQYLSAGRSIEQMDLNAADILSFQGIGSNILSITVEKGHGYLRLKNDENFVGGWIEIGQSLIHRITEDMLLAVPEGSYQVSISNNGSGGTKSIIINRNEEVTLDIGDLKVAEPQTGTVLFSLSPAGLELYIDGTLVDASQPVVLEYGIHQLIARADGYQSITRYLSVGEASAAINLVLDAITNTNEAESTSSESTTTTTVDTTTSYYKVYVDGPEGAEVYLDGNYVGIAPCSFRKVAGSHVITLRRSGYETRSYTIQIDSEDKDFSISFADLVEGSAAGTDESEEKPEETKQTEETKNTEEIKNKEESTETNENN